MADDSDQMDQDADDQEYDLSNGAVTDKYKAAAAVVDIVMGKILPEIKPGKSVYELCKASDDLILAESAKIYNKQKMDKGIAFPTCISLNNCVGHFSPLASEAPVLIKPNDLVKIELGCHIDGFIAQAAHSVIAHEAPPTEPVKGKMADVICACYFAAECCVRLAKPGRSNKELTDAIQKVAEAFHVQPVEGVLSHQLKRYVIDGNKVILQRPDLDQQVDEWKFEVNEVYAIDIVMSTGEGKPKERDTRTTVYKRAVDTTYQLKGKHSRFLLSEISKRFATMPFNLRLIGDETKARFGIVELLNHDLVNPYPVLYEKEGEHVAQMTFTILLLPNSTTRLNSFPPAFVSSEHSINSVPEIQKIMAMSTKRGKKKSKKKGGAKATGQPGAAAPAGGAEEEDGEDEKMAE